MDTKLVFLFYYLGLVHIINVLDGIFSIFLLRHNLAIALTKSKL